MDKVLVDRGLLAECVSVCIRAFGVGDPIEAKLRAILAQPAEAEGVVTKIECTTCRGTGSLEFEGGAVVKACAPCKGTGRDLKAERYALAARLAESIAALSAVTAERDRLREAAELLSRLRGLINCTPENDIDKIPVWISTKHPTIERIDALLIAMAAKEA